MIANTPAPQKLPQLVPADSLTSMQQSFVAQLKHRGFGGDIDTSYATRLTLATDNSAFQQLPAGALFPQSEADIEIAAVLLHKTEFHDLHLAPRGGGTSTIGCSLTSGFVLDCSRHMNRILTIDPQRREAVVEPGVVLDQLNDALAEHGLFFAPNVAPSSRATIGGMASTDGCGKGSRIYGKTSDHVLATRIALTDGQVHIVDARPAAPAPDETVEAICGRVGDIVSRHQAEIQHVFPDLSRYLSGYNLAQAVDDQGRCQLNKLICGSEGTLGLITQLTLKLTPIPDTQTLYALRYESFDDALRDAETLVTYDPSAIESLDEKVMGLARDNPIYERVRDYIEAEDGSTPGAVNLVEFTGHGELPFGVAELETALNEGLGKSTGHYRADTDEAMAALWDLRKGGVGLLGSAAGARKPLPFVEDTVVDPRVLADYVADFRAILDEYGLSYGMFGHIDVGCLHVRPALDLTDPADEAAMRDITTRVAQLAQSYGGLLWNEHGKGYRSEYNRGFFGDTLYAALGEIKCIFDPHNQLNPGKIVALEEGRFPLAHMDEPTRGTYDRQIQSGVRADFPGAMNCNGNGACFDYDASHIMCPSYRATRDRLHSPKGRAGAMREWLRQLSNAGYTPADIEPASAPLMLRTARALLQPAAAVDPEADFSHQVWTAMDGCLGCRACATQCPIKVDVPTFKSQFLAYYHSQYERPRGDYLLAYLERGGQIAAAMPALVNGVLKWSGLRRWLARRFGLVDPPPLSRPSLGSWLRRHPAYQYTPERWTLASRDERRQTVFIMQDAFTSFFDAPTVMAAVETIALLGYRPRVLPFSPSGKPLQVKGFMPEFQRVAQRHARFLDDIAQLGRPIIGIEPSITQSLQADYPALTGQTPPVQSLEQWLVGALQQARLSSEAATDQSYQLLNHCIPESHSSASSRAWQQAFGQLGLSLTSGQVGCCGMSGAYGHEARHHDTSQTVFNLSWAAALADEQTIPLVTGYSCRSQCQRFGNHKPAHPIQILRDRLASQTSPI